MHGCQYGVEQNSLIVVDFHMARAAHGHIPFGRHHSVVLTRNASHGRVFSLTALATVASPVVRDDLNARLNRDALTRRVVAAALLAFVAVVVPLSMTQAAGTSPERAQGGTSSPNQQRDKNGQRAGLISGKVLDGSGNGVVGAFIVVCDQKSGNPLSARFEVVGPKHVAGRPSPELAYAITDHQGRFTLTQIPAGEYRLIAQSWQGVGPGERLTTISKNEVQLRGVANHIKVSPASSSKVVIRPLGTGVLRLDDNINKPGVIVAISKAAPRADPMLGFVAWGGPFAQNAIGACIKPAGTLTLSGLPPGELHVALCGMSADDESGFGVAKAEIKANATTRLYAPIMSSWAKDSPGPPERLRPLMVKIEAVGSRAFFREMLKINGIAWDEDARPTTPNGIWYYWAEIARHVDREVELPSGGKANFGDVIAACHYLAISPNGESKES